MNLPDVEFVAERLHEAWVLDKSSQGFHSYPDLNGDELMLPYEDLSAEVKDHDQEIIQSIYDVILDWADHVDEEDDEVVYEETQENDDIPLLLFFLFLFIFLQTVFMMVVVR